MTIGEQVELFTQGLSLGQEVTVGRGHDWPLVGLLSWEEACSVVRQVALQEAFTSTRELVA